MHEGRRSFFWKENKRVRDIEAPGAWRRFFAHTTHTLHTHPMAMRVRERERDRACNLQFKCPLFLRGTCTHARALSFCLCSLPLLFISRFFQWAALALLLPPPHSRFFPRIPHSQSLPLLPTSQALPLLHARPCLYHLNSTRTRTHAHTRTLAIFLIRRHLALFLGPPHRFCLRPPLLLWRESDPWPSPLPSRSPTKKKRRRRPTPQPALTSALFLNFPLSSNAFLFGPPTSAASFHCPLFLATYSPRGRTVFASRRHCLFATRHSLSPPFPPPLF
jgi:hypothetical protein